MQSIPLILSLAAVAAHPAFQSGGRGALKIIVTSVYEGKERVADSPFWEVGDGPVPVLVGNRTEMAYFTHLTPETCHAHDQATEVYTVLKGEMHIWVDGVVYIVPQFGSIIIPPGLAHEVLHETEFWCQVVASNSGGPSDKRLVTRW